MGGSQSGPVRPNNEQQQQPVRPNNEQQQQPVRPNNEQQQQPVRPNNEQQQRHRMRSERLRSVHHRSRRNSSRFPFLPPPMTDREEERESRPVRPNNEQQQRHRMRSERLRSVHHSHRMLIERLRPRLLYLMTDREEERESRSMRRSRSLDSLPPPRSRRNSSRFPFLPPPRSRRRSRSLDSQRPHMTDREEERESRTDKSDSNLEEFFRSMMLRKELEFLPPDIADKEPDRRLETVTVESNSSSKEPCLRFKMLIRSSSFEFLPPDLADKEPDRRLVTVTVESNSSSKEPCLRSRRRSRSSSFEFLPPDMSELRVVLLGNSWSERSSVGNFILGETKFNTENEPDDCVRFSGERNTKEIVLINTPDMLHTNTPLYKRREFIDNCVRLSAPGPHVFLLVLQPEDFTEVQKRRLCRILQLFSDQSYDHSLIVISTPRDESSGFMETYRQHPPLKDMIKKCKYRFLWRKDLELPELLTRLDQVVKENNGQHVTPRWL